MKTYIFRRKWLFLLTLAITVLWNCVNMFRTVLDQKLIDAVLEVDRTDITKIAIAVVVSAVISGLIYIACQLTNNRFTITVMDDMRKAIFAGVMRRSRKDFFSENYGNYISAITNDMKLIRGQYLNMLFMTVIFGCCMIFSAVMMFLYSPIVTVVAIFCATVMTVLPTVLGRLMKRLSKEHSEKLAELNTMLTELFSGFQVLRSFGVMGHARKKFEQCSTELKKSQQKYEGMDSFSDAFAQFLSVLTQTVILVTSAIMVMNGRMSAGTLVAFTALNGNFCSGLSVVLMGIPMIRGAKPIIENINEFADYEKPQTENAAPTFRKSLKVRNLGFAYQEGVPILEHLSLSIHSGEKCALTGESGSGKTTLIRLLSGELDGYTGDIRYDDVSLTETDCESICHIAAVIHQDVFLFDDTIRNNICLFDEFSEKDFQRALQLSGVSKFIDRFDDGVNHRVGQRGEYLSGGQRQRVAIARALIRNTPFLILDEGTSALDEQTATEIEKELLHIPELTLLTITHNLRRPQDYSWVIRLG